MLSWSCSSRLQSTPLTRVPPFYFILFVSSMLYTVETVFRQVSSPKGIHFVFTARPGDKWRRMEAKVNSKFDCSRCGNVWSSACGVVSLHFVWIPKKQKMLLVTAVFAQDCQKCDGTGAPSLCHSEAKRVLQTLLMRLKALPENTRKRSQRRSQMTRAHDVPRCHRCSQGPGCPGATRH